MEASNLDGRAVDAVHLYISKAFNNIYHHILRQADELPTKLVDSEVDWKLAALLDLRGCGEWHKVQLEASHTSIPQGLVLGLTLIFTLTDNLSSGTKKTYSSTNYVIADTKALFIWTT